MGSICRSLSLTMGVSLCVLPSTNIYIHMYMYTFRMHFILIFVASGVLLVDVLPNPVITTNPPELQKNHQEASPSGEFQPLQSAPTIDGSQQLPTEGFLQIFDSLSNDLNQMKKEMLQQERELEQQKNKNKVLQAELENLRNECRTTTERPSYHSTSTNSDTLSTIHNSVPVSTATATPKTPTSVTTTTVTTTTTTAVITTTTAASSGYVLLVGGKYQSMETWADGDNNHPQYNNIPRENLEGSKAAVLDSRGLLSCGGEDASRDCFTTEGQPDWKPAPSLNVGRRYHSLTAVGGSLVAAGGVGDGSNTLSSVDILDHSGGWSMASWSLKIPVASHCALSTDSNNLIILGGYTDSGISDDIDQYNIETGNHTSLPNLPLPLYHVACTIFNNKIVISGGYTSYIANGEYYGGYKAEVFQLEGNEWVALPSLQHARCDHAMGVLGGQLYVFGGWDAARSVERLNGDQWEEVEQGLEGDFEIGGAIFVE